MSKEEIKPFKKLDGCACGTYGPCCEGINPEKVVIPAPHDFSNCIYYKECDGGCWCDENWRVDCSNCGDSCYCEV